MICRSGLRQNKRSMGKGVCSFHRRPGGRWLGQFIITLLCPKCQLHVLCSAKERENIRSTSPPKYYGRLWMMGLYRVRVPCAVLHSSVFVKVARYGVEYESISTIPTEWDKLHTLSKKREKASVMGDSHGKAHK